jgi:spermidine/putrescine transport system permease protein
MLGINTHHHAEKKTEGGVHSTRSNKIKWLSYPYIVWMIGFIIIPLILVVYYGMTGPDKSFTLENIALISDPINRSIAPGSGVIHHQ